MLLYYLSIQKNKTIQLIDTRIFHLSISFVCNKRNSTCPISPGGPGGPGMEILCSVVAGAPGGPGVPGLPGGPSIP